jgi:hypothetical protein
LNDFQKIELAQPLLSMQRLLILIFAKGKGRDHQWVFDLLKGGGKGDKEAHE